ncbi:ATP-binding protein [Streptomyces prasinus]|uniref:ATP-binding protein n=1 Tax=Streptomyces prasinus TaxID=67345 RepID=UPI003F4CB834
MFVSGSVAAGGDTGTAGRVTRIRVADEGPGIPAEDRERVFDRFHRVDGARSRDRDGSGLNRAVARSLVRARGGGIELSTGGPGPTVFTVRLPLDGSGATVPRRRTGLTER